MFVRVIGTKILWGKIDFYGLNMYAVNLYIWLYFGVFIAWIIILLLKWSKEDEQINKNSYFWGKELPI
jgi:predicted tellurium resistance membrane protein TerC